MQLNLNNLLSSILGIAEANQMQLIASLNTSNQHDGATSNHIHLSTPAHAWDPTTGDELTGTGYDEAAYRAWDKTLGQLQRLLQETLGQPAFNYNSIPDPHNNLGFAPTLWVLPGLTVLLQESDCSIILTINSYEI